jgi:nucleotide-binding universal stress UspA family protein
MYRTILVHVDTEPDAAQRACLAADVARNFEASLIGITAALPRPPVETITAGVMDPSILELERDQTTEDFKVAEQQFRTLAADAGVGIEWRGVANFPTVALANAASAVDLVIVSPGLSGLFGNDYRKVNPGELIVSAGRPVLIAPSGTFGEPSAAAFSERRPVYVLQQQRQCCLKATIERSAVC